jgi:hypothetical protein
VRSAQASGLTEGQAAAGKTRALRVDKVAHIDDHLRDASASPPASPQPDVVQAQCARAASLQQDTTPEQGARGAPLGTTPAAQPSAGDSRSPDACCDLTHDGQDVCMNDEAASAVEAAPSRSVSPPAWCFEDETSQQDAAGEEQLTEKAAASPVLDLTQDCTEHTSKSFRSPAPAHQARDGDASADPEACALEVFFMVSNCTGNVCLMRYASSSYPLGVKLPLQRLQPHKPEDTCEAIVQRLSFALQVSIDDCKLRLHSASGLQTGALRSERR